LHRVPQDINPNSSAQGVQMGGESLKVNMPPTPGVEKTAPESSKPPSLGGMQSSPSASGAPSPLKNDLSPASTGAPPNPKLAESPQEYSVESPVL
jgi:hypothetical protein